MENNKIFSCVIIDDTPQCISILTKLIDKYFPEVKIKGTAKSVQEGISLIKKTDPEIVFLDVEMPGENGTALFDYLEEPNFETIFTTAFEDYAAQAFRLNSIDYLVKPVKPSELKEAISKVKQKYQNNNEKIVNMPEISPETRITFSTLDSIEIIKIKDIFYCQAENNYTTVYASNKKSMVSKHLGFYEEILKDYGFFRVNRSQLINLYHVERIEKTGTQEITLSNGSKIPIAGRRKKDLMDRLSSYTLKQ